MMTKRERLITALKHEEPDRIPVDLGSMRSTGITALAYYQLINFLKIRNSTIRVYDTGQQLAEPEKKILELFGVDVIDITRSLPPCGPYRREWKKWTLPNGIECEVPKNFNPEPDGKGGWVIRNDKGIVISRMPPKGFYFDGIYHPLEKIKSINDIDDYNWEAHKISDKTLRKLRENAIFLRETTDYGLLFHSAGSIHEWGQGLRGWTNWIVDLSVRKKIAEKMLDHMIEVIMYNVKKLVSALDGIVDVLGFGDDLGTQNGPQISPKIYREMLKSYHEEMYGYVRKHSKMFIFLHSCGSIYDLLPDLIDAGVEIINPVQISAAKMNPRNLKEKFGEELVFWGGGVDTQNILINETPENVSRHVKENICIFGKNGGFVFTQVHNIQPFTPPENIVTAYKTVLKYGKYPLSFCEC